MPDAQINGLKHFWLDEGSGEPLVVVHGAAGSGAQMGPVLAPLASDFRIIVPDLRSMGKSEHVDSIPPSAWEDDLIGLMDHLGLAKAHFFGASLGARIALRLAIDHPERVHSLTLVSPIVANESAGSEALNAGFDVATMSPERKATYKDWHGDDWEDVIHHYVGIRNDPKVQEYYNLRQSARTVKLPTLLLHTGNEQD